MHNENLSIKQCLEFVLKQCPVGWFASDARTHFENEVSEIPSWMYEEPSLRFIEDSIEDLTARMHICGCGNPELTWEAIRVYLNILAKDFEDYSIRENDIAVSFPGYQEDTVFGLYQFMAYILDANGFTEHGSSIGSAWLTEKGNVLRCLLNFYSEQGGLS